MKLYRKGCREGGLILYPGIDCRLPVMANSERTIRIGEAASRAGVNIQTLRYYERRGLLPRAARDRGGFRVYTGDVVRLIRFIRRAQDLGFTLQEVGELIQLRSQPRRSVARVRAIATAKLASISEKTRRLQAMQRALESLTDACACQDSTLECPIIDALDDAQELREQEAARYAAR